MDGHLPAVRVGDAEREHTGERLRVAAGVDVVAKPPRRRELPAP
jgi:hypothetical protein